MIVMYVLLLLLLLIITLVFIYKYNNGNNYNVQLVNIKELLQDDYKSYKKCINLTNEIVCGRSSSKNQKKKKVIKPTDEYVFNKPTNTISKRLKKCDKDNITILIAIVTGPDYFAERYIYRKFYSQFTNLQFFFFTGISENKTINNLIKNENKVYNDIVLFPFISNFHSVSLNDVSEFKWIRRNCNKYRWLIHHQADVFINVNKSIQLLNNTKCIECCIGQIKVREKIYRDKSEMVYLPENLYPNATEWPPYLNGPVIFFTNKSLEILNNLIGKVHPQFWLDDVYFGLLFQHTNISLIEIGLAYYATPRISLERAYSLYAIHNLNPSELYYLTNQYI